MIVHFLGNCKVITWCFFIWIFTERVERCEEDGLSSLLVFFSSCHESVLEDGLNAEGTTPVKHKLFPIVRNLYVLHQFRRNCYSTRVSLNCSIESQGFFGILATLEPHLAASFMDESKPVFFWEVSCSLFCERCQQFRPYRVPMNRCIRLSFFLIMMTHQSCDHFGDRCWERSSPYDELAGIIFPLPFRRRNGSCVQEHWAGRDADRVRIQFPDARMTCNRGRNKFPWASLRLRQARFAFFCVCMFRE